MEASRTAFPGRGFPYRAMAWAGAALGLLGALADASLLYALGGMAGAGAAYGLLWAGIREVRLHEGELWVFRGLRAKPLRYPLANASLLSLHESTTQPLPLLHDPPHTRALLVQSPARPKLSLPASAFRKDDFQFLLRAVDAHYHRHVAPFPERVRFMLRLTAEELEADRRLASMLEETRREVFHAVYRPFEVPFSKRKQAELEADGEVLFHSVQRGNLLVYYCQGHWREEASPRAREMALALDDAARRQQEAVDAQLAAHREAKSTLEKMVAQLEREAKLAGAAAKIEQLHQAQSGRNRPDTAFEAEVLQQLMGLTEDLRHADVLDQARQLEAQLDLLRHDPEWRRLLSAHPSSD
jgi:hypothetical protein